MKILALDSSAKTASAAITDSEQLISEAFVNAGLTHSETLLPMVDSVLSLARLTMAYNLRYDNCIACCAMDARCSQVYSAIFRCFDGKVERLTEDDAIPASKLPEILEKYANERIICVGDGAHIAYQAVKDSFKSVSLAQDSRRFQRAYGAACAAVCENMDFIPPAQLLPVYLRPSQAERELSLKKSHNQ